MEDPCRCAAPTDLDLLLDLMRQFYAIDGYPFAPVVARGALADLIGDAALGRVWLILDGAVPVGYLAVTFGYSLEYGGRDAFIDEFFVRADARGRGLGTRALRFAIEECRHLGVRALHLEVEGGNARAEALYRAQGFGGNRRALLTRRLDG